MSASKTTGTKGRLLFLLAYLMEHTDDNHVITTSELLRLYEENGYKCHRTTIPDDIAVLQATGIDIIVEQVPRNETSMNAYYIGNRLFELAELKMLVDAVSSSRFITAEKSDLLIDKLSKLTNAENRNQLTANIFQSDRLKTSNTNVFVNMDVIRTAIDNHRQISFHYWDYTPLKERVLRHDGELYVASPYALVWNDDRYYVSAYSEKHGKVVSYRVDRMCDVQETKDEAIANEGFNAATYGRNAIKMFDGGLPVERVSLVSKNSLMKKIVDRFGEDIETEIVNADTFRANVQVIPSSTFFGWVVQYRGEIIIEAPPKVKEAYEDFLGEIVRKQKEFRSGIK